MLPPAASPTPPPARPPLAGPSSSQPASPLLNEPAPRYQHEAATVVTGSNYDVTRRAPTPATRMDTPPAAHEAVDQWKIRSPVGLVYDFPDLAALKNWLSSRDSVDGMSASKDGGVTWMLLTDFDELRDALPKVALSRRTSGYDEVATTAAKTVVLQQEEVTQPSATIPAPPPPRTSQPGIPPSQPPTRPPVVASDPASVPPTPPISSQGAEAAKTQLLSPPPTAAPESVTKTGPRPSLHSGPRAALTSGSHPAIGLRGATSGQTSIRQNTTSARRAVTSHQGLRPVGRARPAGPRKAGLGTYLGLLLTSLILVVLTLQIIGVTDFYELLGLRNREAATPSSPAVDTPSVGVPQTPVDTTVSPELTQDPTEPGQEDPLTLLQQRRDGQHPHASRILSLTNQARRAADEGRFDEAIDLVNNALMFDRTNPDLVCMLADFHREAGSLTQAIEYTDECNSLRSSGSELPPEEER